MFASRFMSAVKAGFREFTSTLAGDRVSTDSMSRVEQGSGLSLKARSHADYPTGDLGQRASSKPAQGGNSAHPTAKTGTTLGAPQRSLQPRSTSFRTPRRPPSTPTSTRRRA
ncbi:hypothetical protein MTO96_019256 [Rhipicephalus appendiculatus]